MTIRRTYLLLGLLLLSAPVDAAELRASLVSATSYNSNVYGTEDNEDGDFILRLGPELELRGDTEKRFDYLLSYRGDWERYAQESDASAMGHRQRLRLRYDLSRRTRATLNQRYRRISNLQFDRDDFAAGDTGLDINQNRYERNDIALDVEHTLSRRWTLAATLEHQIVDFQRNFDRSDSTTVGLGMSMRYRLAERHDVGFGVRFANQNFDDAPSRLGADSDYLNLVGLWTFRISERARFEFEGGPTWIDSRQDAQSTASAPAYVGRELGDDLFRANFFACSPGAGQQVPVASRCVYDDPQAPPIPASDLGPRQDYLLDFTGIDRSDDELTFFGRASLTAGWSDWELATGYERQQSATAGESLATSLDRLSLSVDYRPAPRRWEAYTELRWERREELTDALAIDYTLLPGADSAALRDDAFIDSSGGTDQRDFLTTLFGGRYLISPRWSTGLEARFRQADEEDGQDSSTYIVEFSLRYDFAPERF